MKPQTEIHVDFIWATIYGFILTIAAFNHNGLAGLGFSILFIGKILDGVIAYLKFKNGK